jgi:hypothetical protein
MQISSEQLARLPPGRRQKAEALLAQLADLREENPLQFRHACATDCGVPGCRPFRQQAEFLASRDFRKAFFGGNGAGKTEIGVIDDLIQLCDRAVLPERFQRLKRWDPPFFLRVVAPKMSNIEGTLLEKFRSLTPRSQLVDGRFDKSYDKVHRRLRFRNGSYVLFNTADQDVDAHSGVRLHRVHFDEEPEGAHGRQVYHENLMRLRDFMPEAQVMFTMTPLFGLSWSYEELWERRDDEGTFCTVASLLDNPYVDGAALVKEAERTMSKQELQARVEGRFVHFTGRVVDLTDDHLVDDPDERHVRGLEAYVGIDPGIARGGVIWAGFDRDHHLLAFDELYPEHLTVPEIALEVFLKNARWGLGNRQERANAAKLVRERLEAGAIDRERADAYMRLLRLPTGRQPIYVIDPSARNRALTNAQSVEAEFQRCGIFAVHGQNDREAGILQLRARLEHRTLLVARGCKWLRWEAERWRTAKDEILSEETSSAGDAFTTKGPDHLWDPLRYVAMERLMFQAPRRDYRELWRPGFSPPREYWAASPSRRESPPLGSMS